MACVSLLAAMVVFSGTAEGGISDLFQDAIFDMDMSNMLGVKDRLGKMNTVVRSDVNLGEGKGEDVNDMIAAENKILEGWASDVNNADAGKDPAMKHETPKLMNSPDGASGGAAPGSASAPPGSASINTTTSLPPTSSSNASVVRNVSNVSSSPGAAHNADDRINTSMTNSTSVANASAVSHDNRTAVAPFAGTGTGTLEDVNQKLHALEAQLKKRNVVDWTVLMGQVGDSVVQLYVTKAQASFAAPQNGFTPVQVAGTGFFVPAAEFDPALKVEEEALIVTNAHVARNAVKIQVLHRKKGQEPFEAEVVGICSARDLALLRLKDISAFKKSIGLQDQEIVTLKFGDSDQQRSGDSVAALGYPLGLNGLKVSLGIVSGYQVFEDALYMQMDAAINHGNSGGPLVNSAGEVIGINSAGIPSANGMSFAIPSKCVKVLLDTLYVNREWPLPELGIQYNDATDDMAAFLGYKDPSRGVFIHTVQPSGGLLSGKLQPEDFLVEINKLPVDRFGQVAIAEIEASVNIFGLLARQKVGTDLTFTVWRASEKKLVEAQVSYDKTPPPIIPQIEEPLLHRPLWASIAGIVFTPATGNLLTELLGASPQVGSLQHSNAQKVVVADVMHSSPAHRTKTAQAGMVVKAVNGLNVTTLQTLCRAVSKPVERDGISYFILESEEDDLTVLDEKDLGKTAGDCKKLLQLTATKASSNTTASADGNTPTPTPTPTSASDSGGEGNSEKGGDKTKLGDSHSQSATAKISEPTPTSIPPSTSEANITNSSANNSTNFETFTEASSLVSVKTDSTQADSTLVFNFVDLFDGISPGQPVVHDLGAD